MKIRYFLIVALALGISQKLFSQERYWVFFTDKERGDFYPERFFDSKALERRAQLGINPDIQEEWPVNQTYISRVAELTHSTGYSSRWFNALSVTAFPEQIEQVGKLPYVSSIEKQYLDELQLAGGGITEDENELQEPEFLNQVRNLEGELFTNSGITGRGIRIAVFDAGFPGVNTNPCFEHLRAGNRIIRTWDFTRKKENVYTGNRHGTAVLSCIAGICHNSIFGLATEAEFMLARTEIRAEIYAEEEYWLAAVEWADQYGAQIINSSLGYTAKRYFPEQMDGKTSLVSRAANMAARKGILVINAAGNEGDTRNWKIIGAPADADSVLSVGGYDEKTEMQIKFSSFGPTADYRLKPNVIAFGAVSAATPSGTGRTQGTSFASPLVAGFAACIWQMNPKMTNMEIFEEIQKSASLYPYYDYAHGYGIPQASYFIDKTKPEQSATFVVDEEDDLLVVHINENFLPKDEHNYLFYHIAGENGRLRKYYVVKMGEANSYSINISELEANDILRIHYQGYTYEHR
jgi:serine protease AprX